jgi:predicted dehydrogenase
MAALRFGIVGTGQWSRHSHIPGATASTAVEFVGAIGRHDDFDAWLDSVDAVGFAVPPDVESELALRAVRAGKHVLLDKPIATDVPTAERLASAVSDAGVASIVFLTRRFIEPVAQWLDEARATGGWTFGRTEMISDALAGMPNPGWRAERGGLWDVGPHTLSVLLPVLGPARTVSATRDSRGLVVTTLAHDAATSVMTTTIGSPVGSGGDTFLFVGEPGRTAYPPLDEPSGRADRAYSRAIDALVAQVGAPGHPCDVHFGAEIVRVLDAAERSIDAGSPVDL